ncbi:Sensory transduction protein regX3 [compost metagenome]
MVREMCDIKKILIVEDDAALSQGIVLAFKDSEFSFVQAKNLDESRQYIKSDSFDLIILDLNLPDGNGLDVLKELRRSSAIPVIILTANDMETDVVTGLELGADDYITKPFSLMILRARVNARLRSANAAACETIEIDGFRFSFGKMEFSKNGDPVELSKTEQKLLRVLVENSGHTLTRAQLVDLIWTNGAEYVDENALSVAIKRLRDKLEDAPSSPKYIRTIYGIGYTWAII